MSPKKARAISEAFGSGGWIKISSRINFRDKGAAGTVALVPRGLCGLSEIYFFYFAFILNLTRFVLGGTRQCLGLRTCRSRGNPRTVLNPNGNRNSRVWLPGCVRWVLAGGAWPRALRWATGSAQSGCHGVGHRLSGPDLDRTSRPTSAKFGPFKVAPPTSQAKLYGN